MARFAGRIALAVFLVSCAAAFMLVSKTGAAASEPAAVISAAQK